MRDYHTFFHLHKKLGEVTITLILQRNHILFPFVSLHIVTNTPRMKTGTNGQKSQGGVSGIPI